MRSLVILFSFCILLHAQDTWAGPAEVRETARLNNCTPKKIQVYQQKLGKNALTIYRVDCIEPKAVGENLPKTPDSILVECESSMCRMLRALEEKQQ
ncbi:MAG: hypothetical protein PHD48_06080 [Alphaproteobacteria bacterium]|nr:hypothetical protein [Alphaproteobacteria bacterium]